MVRSDDKRDYSDLCVLIEGFSEKQATALIELAYIKAKIEEIPRLEKKIDEYKNHARNSMLHQISKEQEDREKAISIVDEKAIKALELAEKNDRWIVKVSAGFAVIAVIIVELKNLVMG